MVSRGARQRVRISAAGISSRGFTLLELLVVLFILSGAAVLVLPRLTAMQDGDARSSARNIAAMMRYLDERAVAGRTRYRLQLDLNEQKISVQQLGKEGVAKLPDDPFLQRNPLIGSARLEDVSTERSGIINSGSIAVTYGIGGLSEPIVLHLGIPGREKPFTVQALPTSGSVRVAEGRLEMIR